MSTRKIKVDKFVMTRRTIRHQSSLKNSLTLCVGVIIITMSMTSYIHDSLTTIRTHEMLRMY